MPSSRTTTVCSFFTFLDLQDDQKNDFLNNWKWIVEKPAYGVKETLLGQEDLQRAIRARAELLTRYVRVRAYPSRGSSSCQQDENDVYQDPWGEEWGEEEGASLFTHLFTRLRCPMRNMGDHQ